MPLSSKYKPGLATKDKKSFKSDFTAILTLSMASNAKGVCKKDMQDIKSCIKDGDFSKAWKILGKGYSVREWESFVHAQAAPLMKA